MQFIDEIVCEITSLEFGIRGIDLERRDLFISAAEAT